MYHFLIFYLPIHVFAIVFVRPTLDDRDMLSKPRKDSSMFTRTPKKVHFALIILWGS